jgi:hypothetical protein
MYVRRVRLQPWALAFTAGVGLAIVGGAGCAAPTAVVAPPPAAGIESWSQRFPPASQALGEWVRLHPQAAGLFFKWDGAHPERAKEFVTWAILYPGQPIGVFVAAHPGWPVFDQIAMNHRPAAEAFMGWCRTHPRAAEALMNHPRGLEWAGHHLYATYWTLETH